MATSALLRLLALASIIVLSTTLTPACVDPAPPADDDDNPADDDDTVVTPECTVEADGAINGTTVIARKASDESVIFDDCDIEDGICSLRAPAGLDLVLYAERENVVGCEIEVNLEPSATPHEITIPMGYGGESHGYDYYNSDGQLAETYEVETTCQDGVVKVNTHGVGMFEVVGDQLLANPAGVSGSVTSDLELYEFSSGGRLERRP